MSDWLEDCRSTFDHLAQKVGLHLVEESLNQRDLVPPEGARAWMGSHAVVLLAPIELASGWDARLASCATRWVGDVIDHWWTRGRVLDAYVVLVSAEPPAVADRAAIDEWHGRTHICRRRVIWQEVGDLDWQTALEGLPFMPVPLMAQDDERVDDLPVLPERMVQLISWVTGEPKLSLSDAANRVHTACNEALHAD